jgi:hypothetical protein
MSVRLHPREAHRWVVPSQSRRHPGGAASGTASQARPQAQAQGIKFSNKNCWSNFPTSMSADLIDLTDMTDAGQSSLECEVLYGKTQKGILAFDGCELIFRSSEGEGQEVYFPCTAIKGMQVSKAGSSKTLLKIISDSSLMNEALFDFSSTTNGVAWRDAFKEGLTKRIRTISESNAPDPQTPKVPVSNGGKISGPRDSSSKKQSTLRESVKLTAADIKGFLEAHPALLELYAEQVYSISEV